MTLGVLTPEAVKQAVQEALNNDNAIPPGHNGALVTYIDQSKAQLVVAAKINDNWVVNFVGEHDWTGDNKVGLTSKITW